MSEAEFGTEDIKQIYRLRWQVEVGFRGLKRNTDLEWTHSRKRSGPGRDLCQNDSLQSLFPFAQQGRKISSAPEAHRSGQKHKQKADFIHHQNDSTVAVQKSQNQLEYTGRSSSGQDISDQRRKS
ncbi:transposase [Allobaculum mucilyticum]|uniref:transposase n=1 Tax=Allobaculum mucilyticum TaxID=2834459 RepID=UPI003BF86A0C|nr:transposase [Allobaculum mucilyticum]